MKNLLCALSVLTVCTASKLSTIHPVFDSLIIRSNRSVELKLKTEDPNNDTNNKTLDSVLKTIVDVKNLHRIVNILYENEFQKLSFIYPDVFFQQGDNESKELNTKHLKNEESLPRNEEEISIARTKRNLDDLEKNDRLQILSGTLDFLVRHIKDVTKSALSEVFLELSKKYMNSSQNQLRMISEIRNVLNHILDLLNLKLGAEITHLPSEIIESENETEAKLEELYLEAKIIYEEIYYKKLFQNSCNLDKVVETSTSIFHGLDELNAEFEKNKKNEHKKKKEELETSNSIVDGLDELNAEFEKNKKNEHKKKKEELETSNSIVDGLDELNAELEKNEKNKSKKSQTRAKKEERKDQEMRDRKNLLFNYFYLTDKPYIKNSKSLDPVLGSDNWRKAFSYYPLNKQFLKEKSEEVNNDLNKRRDKSMLENEGNKNQDHVILLDEEIPEELEATRKNLKQFDEDRLNLKHLSPKIYDDSSTTMPFEIATDLDINATNADGISKTLISSLAEVHGLPKLGEKNVDVTGTQDKEAIKDVLKRKNADFAKNYGLPGLQKNKTKDLPKMSQKREEGSVINSTGMDDIVPSKRGMFENLDRESSKTEVENSGESTKRGSKNVMDAILEAINEVIPPSSEENETLRYKKPILTKDTFFDEVLKDESV